MKALVLVVAACGGSPTQVANLATPEIPIVDAYCPPIADVGPFSPELFRACAGPPFAAPFALCAGKACEAPCRGHHSVDGGSIDAAIVRRGDWHYRYDQQGRYLGSDKGDDCIWDAAGRMGECHGFKPIRDDHGRLIGVTTFSGVIQIRYDDRGRVTAVGKTNFTYDATGALSRIGELALEREQGRVVREKSPDGTTATYHYDLQNRVIAKDLPEGGTTVVEHVAYDGDRVASMYVTGTDMTSSSRFDYDGCLH